MGNSAGFYLNEARVYYKLGAQLENLGLTGGCR